MRDQQNNLKQRPKSVQWHFGPIITGLSLEIGHHRKRLLGGSAPDPSISVPNTLRVWIIKNRNTATPWRCSTTMTGGLVPIAVTMTINMLMLTLVMMGRIMIHVLQRRTWTILFHLHPKWAPPLRPMLLLLHGLMLDTQVLMVRTVYRPPPGQTMIARQKTPGIRRTDNRYESDECGKTRAQGASAASVCLCAVYE